MPDTDVSEIEQLVGAISLETVREETRLKLFTKLVFKKKGNVTFPEQYVDGMIDYYMESME